MFFAANFSYKGTTEDTNIPRHDIMMDSSAANTNSGTYNRPPSGGAPPKYNSRPPHIQQPKYGNYNRAPPPNPPQNVPRMPPKQPYMVPNVVPGPHMNGINPQPYLNMVNQTV